MASYVEYTLEDGSKLLVEVDEPKTGIVKASREDGNIVIDTSKKFQSALLSMRSSSIALMQEIEALKVDEAEVKYGLRATGEAGIFAVGKLGGEINFEITLKWKRSEPKNAEK